MPGTDVEMSSSHNGVPDRPSKRRKTEEGGVTLAGDTSQEKEQSTKGIVDGNIPEKEENDEEDEKNLPPLVFEDGNVRIRSSDKAEFILHAGVLSYHSQVLKDLIEKARQDQHEKSSYNSDNKKGRKALPVDVSDGDGREYIDLDLPESKLELRLFFGAIYDGGKSEYINRDQNLSFRYLRAVLLLGIKYKVKHIVDAGVGRLRSLFPSQLSYWTNWPISGAHSPIPLEAEDAITVVYMATQADALDLLPVAYYVCCTLSPGWTVNGVDYDDWDGDVYRLSENEVKMCHAAQSELQKMRMWILRVLMEGATGAYDSICLARRGKCGPKLLQISLQAMDEQQYSVAQCFSPLNSWIDKADGKLTEKLCSPCKKAVKNDIASRLQAEWGKLGKLFNIEDWPPKKK